MIDIKNMKHKYDQQIIENISLKINKNEKVAIVGPSGCGKSTILKLILNIENIQSGEISINKNNEMIGYMPQNDLLFEWYTIKENLLLPLKINKKNTNFDLENVLRDFKLDNILDKYPRELSGGMKSRISLIRAYLMSQELLVLDEPLSKLDYITHNEIVNWLKEYLKNIDITLLLVTHNIEEAIDLSDKIIVLSNKPAKIIGNYICKDYQKEELKEIIINKLK